MDLDRRNGWTVVAASGELDVATSPSLRAALIEAISDNPFVVVDLSECTFIDSIGLGVLVGALRRISTAGGQLRLACADPLVLRLFEITGLTATFGVCPDLDTATRDHAGASLPAYSA